MKLLNFATVLIIWVTGLQYSINNFLAPYIEERQRNAGKATDEASAIRDKFIRICQWIILFLFLFIVIIATWGYFSTLKVS